MRAALRINVPHPYRAPPQLDPLEHEVARDDTILGVLLLVLGGFRMAVTIATGEVWRAEPTIALLMVLCGLGLLLPRKRPVLDMFYVLVILVLFMLALGVVELLERL